MTGLFLVNLELGVMSKKALRLAIILLLSGSLTQCEAPPEPLSKSEKEWPLAAGHGKVTLLGAIDGSSEHPAWSPDGTRIAFQHTAHRLGSQDGLLARDIYVINRDGSAMRRLTSVAEQSSCKYPSWAPDSRQLLAVCELNGETGVYLLDVGTATLRLVMDVPEHQVRPTLSPNGREFAFTKWTDVEPYTTTTKLSDGHTFTFTETLVGRLYVVNLDGSELRQLTHGPYDIDPAWSPDGQTLSFTSVGEHCQGRRCLCTVRVYDLKVMCLEEMNCDQSTWSPDGSTIACVSREGIIAVNISGGPPIMLLPEENHDFTGLSWSPEGARLVFAVGPRAGVANELYILDLDTPLQ